MTNRLALRASIAMRPRVLVPMAALASLAAPPAGSQAKAHERFDLSGSFLPTSVAAVEDRDGDGLRDLLVGGGYTGQVNLIASDDGALLADFSTHDFDALYGFSVASAGDADGDGSEDYLVGMPRARRLGQRVGGARIVSGATGATLRDLYGTLPDTMFGARVLDAGDVDGDGFSDSVLASVDATGAGVLRSSSVFSGATGAVLHGYSATGVRVGYEPVGDVDHDGRADLLRPEIEVAMPNGSTGRVSLISGADGHVLCVFQGAAGESNFGFVCAGAGDLDRDGVPDLLLGPRVDSSGVTNYAAVRSGATGAELLRMSYPIPGLTLGIDRALALKDADGDGRVDYLLSALGSRKRVVSGIDGSVLFEYGVDFYDLSVADAGDLNLDGKDDLLIAGALINSPGVLGWASYLSDCPRPTRACSPPLGGCPPYLGFSGGSSLTVGDPAELRAYSAPPGVPGFLIWNTGAIAAPFAQGSLCVSHKNAHVQPVGNAIVHPGIPCFDNFAFVMTRTYLVQHGASAGDTIHAQFVSPAPAGTWRSEAVLFSVCP